MITILHGEHSVDSRAEFTKIRQNAIHEGMEVIPLEGRQVDKSVLVQALESHSLFSTKKLVIIENLLTTLRPGKSREELIEYLCQGKFDADVILWEGKGVGRTIIKLKRAKHVAVKEFKTPVVIFNFLDSLAPNNASQSLYYFRTALSSSVPEIVFAMLVRQFRLLIGLASNAQLPEVTRLAPWQKNKLTLQAALFSGSTLKLIYRNLLLIEYQTKTGRSPYDLTKRMEQFIISL
jgi:DNA polymerase III delta subunit